MKKSAFTLIELLVVIAIIALLAGISMPVYQKVMEKARVVEDANNLKSLGVGVLAYLNDNGDQMFGTDTSATAFKWPVVLQAKYVTDWKAFHSPFDPRPLTQTSPIPISYGFNINVFGANTAAFTSMSSVVLMAPAVTLGTTGDQEWLGDSTKDVTITPPAATAAKCGTHSGKNMINILYADSHVGSVKWDIFKDSTSVPDGKRLWDPFYQQTTP